LRAEAGVAYGTAGEVAGPGTGRPASGCSARIARWSGLAVMGGRAALDPTRQAEST
jgi:hypothetical protein